MRHGWRCQADGDHQRGPRSRHSAEAGGSQMRMHGRLAGPRPPGHHRECQSDETDHIVMHKGAVLHKID